MPASQSHLRRFLLLLLAMLGLVWSMTPAIAQPATETAPAEPKKDADEPGSEWMRLATDDDGKPLGMQTAVVRYEGKSDGGQKIAVDLIGAVHVGDAGYYEKLNKLFEQYETLLYELVAPEGTVIQPGTKASNRHALGAMQNGMKNMLKLEHQLEKVDYTKSNFVHADMSPTEFAKSMKDRNESFLKLYFRVVGESMAAQSNVQGDTGDMEMFRALFSKPEERARRLKIGMAKQMTAFGDMFANLGGEKGTTLITERNRKALDVLREQLKQGRKSVGIFYGAGHLADMDKRLKEEFGLKPTKVDWLTAWNLEK